MNMTQTTETRIPTALKSWQFWSFVTALVIHALDVTQNLLNFQVRLLLMQVELEIAESAFARFFPRRYFNELA
jgi:hypothetical protein